MPTWNGDQKAAANIPVLLNERVLQYLVELVELGALVSFGTSRDQGALSVHVRLGDVKNREWFRTPEELEDWLSEGVKVCEAHASKGPSNVKPMRTA